MKRTGMVTIAVVLGMLLLFESCSKSNKNVESEEDDSVTLKIANYAILESGYESFWKGVKNDFEEKYPDIKIEWVTAPYGDVVNQVINMAGGGEKIDAVYGEITWVPSLEDAGLAAPVTDILPANFLSDFYPDILKAFDINGKPYGIPLFISPYILYYNKNLFKQAGLDPNRPPKNYDEMLHYAEKLSKLKDPNGNQIYAFGQTTASVPVSGSSINGMVFNFGGTVLDEKGKLSIDNTGFKETFEMLQLLDKKGYNPQNAKLKDLRNLFALGRLAMYYDQSWGFNGVQSINPDAKDFTASAAPLKGGSGDGKSILQAHCLILVDNGKSHTDALSCFCQYLITAQCLGGFMSSIIPAYPAKKSMSNMDGIINSPILSGAASAATNVKNQTFIPQLNDLDLELCKLAQAVTVGNQNIDTAIDDFKKTVSVKLGN